MLQEGGQIPVQLRCHDLLLLDSGPGSGNSDDQAEEKEEQAVNLPIHNDTQYPHCLPLNH